MRKLKRQVASKQVPSRAALLAAIPVKNTLVRESQRTDKSLRLTAPLKSSGLRKLLAPKAVLNKSFELDDLGIYVWDHIDGQVSLERLIHQFAEGHRLNLREAEVSVLAFVQTLTQRNLIGLVA